MPEGWVEVWCVPSQPHSRLVAWRGVLDAQERARADRFHFAADGALFIDAHALTRAMLSALGAGAPPERLAFARPQGDVRGGDVQDGDGRDGGTGSARGKPRLVRGAGMPDLRFSLSHTRGMVVCAVAAGMEVGVDVEYQGRQVDPGLAAHFFGAADLAWLDTRPETDRQADFLALWTLKEAYLKGVGAGLHAPLDAFHLNPGDLRLDLDPARLDALPTRYRDLMRSRWGFARFHAGPAYPAALAVNTAWPVRAVVRDLPDVGAALDGSWRTMPPTPLPLVCPVP